MDIYSAKEKDDILIEIISKDCISIDTKRGMSIIDEFLFPEGLIEKPMRLCMPDHYICTATQKGKDFIEIGGFQALQKEHEDEINRKNELDKLMSENLRLQNEELNYKKKIRHQESIIRLHQYIEAVSWIVSIVVASILIFSKN
ncbi:hypothetical protein [Bacteroides faecium]|uniref:Uncharacterized protein n=1 Tax=Bacteroides faecium TaxID=2715212 RepID=A0A6H0KQF3_9BACE|nr:hypothetical protein [Bacteroides faecium]QIU95620.1 hypothetical protein BacF7301_16335 [Bacteroides faecium]